MVILLNKWLFILVFPCVHAAVIKTPSGRIRGKELTAHDGSLVHSFRVSSSSNSSIRLQHVPYAKPPLDNLRFALPSPPIPWEGERDGTEYGPACMTNSTTSSSNPKYISEDCLHNNIFVSDRCLRGKKPCSVVFYIHGGAFNYDSAVMFPDEEMVNNFGANDVVLVLTAFRLGTFGLLTFSDDAVTPTNIPIHDIIASLRWVQGHIGSFGGNRLSVTIMGHSGGGAAVSSLAFSKTIDPTRKLFHRAIIMSGAGVYAPDVLQRRSKTWEFVEKAGCLPYRYTSIPSVNYIREVVECLRQRDADLLLAVQRQIEEDGYTFDGFLLPDPLFPGTDVHDVFTNPPKVPVMIGTTVLEMDSFRSILFSTVDVSDGIGMHRPMAVAGHYEKEKEASKLDYNYTSQTQGMFLNTHRFAEEASKTGAPCYLYSYRNRAHPYHTDDLSYLMGVHKFDPDENEAVLAELYPQYFISYIKTGVPDPDWEPYRPEDSNYFAIDVNVKTGLGPKNSLHYEANVVNYWTRNLNKFDQSLGPYTDERAAVFPVIFPNSTVLPAQPEIRSYLVPTHSPFSWSHLLLAVGLILCGFFVGRCTAPTRTKQILLRYPDEVTPLFFKENSRMA